MPAPDASLFNSSGPRPSPIDRNSLFSKKPREIAAVTPAARSAPPLSYRPSPVSQQMVMPLPVSIFPSSDLEDTIRDTRLAASLALPSTKARAPRASSYYEPSPFRPPVAANHRALLWTTPFSRDSAAECSTVISPALQALIFSKLAGSVVPETLNAYGAGLIRFTQFCDSHRIPESMRMPASVPLLAAFVVNACGTIGHGAIKNWLNGLAFWHKLNLAPWHGKEDWVPLVLRTAMKEGVKFKRPPREGAALWATATAAFWGCRRLGEVTVPSEKKIDRLRHVMRGCTMSYSRQLGREVLVIDLPWTKTTGIIGGKCILTQTDDDLCPVAAMENHLKVNHSASSSTPLFAYRVGRPWKSMTKPFFLNFTTRAYRDAHLEHVFGHSYCIGCTVQLLKDGVAPEVVMKIGGWSSMCFLIYWRRLEQIIPAALSRAWAQKRKDLTKVNGLQEDLEDLGI
ncbi:hypothetical protein BDZ89DRAFT_1150524 [Hymenopellis radicata]|nr:hypothetical protein BDZ89DRAFT_1150524 [Hymenopellis radicata]